MCSSDLSFCMPGAADGWCTFSCAMSCPAGTACVNGLCRFNGPGASAAPCLTPADCKHTTGGATCAPVREGGGRCTRACTIDANCPGDQVCSPDGTCATPGGPGALGWPCDSGFDCASGRCLPVSQGAYAAICVEPCTVASDCPASAGCFPVKSASEIGRAHV